MSTCRHCEKPIAQRYAGTFWKAWVHVETEDRACTYAEPEGWTGAHMVTSS